MSRILFENERPPAQVDPARADVACFVGLIRCNSAAVLPPAVQDWLKLQGWVEGPFARLSFPVTVTLAAAASVTDLQITLTPMLVGAAPAYVAVDTEIFAVTAIDSTRTKLTVTRGARNSAAAAHAAGAQAFSPVAALATVIAAGDTAVTLSVPLTDAFPSGGGQPQYLQIDEELVGLTTIDPTATRLTVARGAKGTAAIAHGINAPVFAPIAPSFLIADVPLPIDAYPAFTALFDAGGSLASVGTDYVAAAVRTFFAQGGKRCYVIRMDDPVTPQDTVQTKSGKLQKLLPTSTFAVDDQTGWHGAGHLAGLPDVSFLAMPDLPALTASAPEGAIGQEPTVPSGPEQFVECSNEDLTTTAPIQYAAAAPRLRPEDYNNWARALQIVLRFLSTGSLREMLLVAAFPLPQNSGVAAASEHSMESLTQDIRDVVTAQMPEIGGLNTGISTAFLQLGYPWLKTTGSHVLLEGLEPPDGALTGILARNALTRGTFTSATKVAPSEIFDIAPVLPAQETRVSATPLTWGDNSPKPLIERLSLFGFTPTGLVLLSDVTAYAGESYRSGRIHRLVAVILRAARRLGEEVVFQSNGPLLWARVQTFLGQLMTRLWQLDALDGETIADAFSVRCDRSTMTQNDLDNGRLVAEVSFNAAATIELIRVTLALETSGTSAQSIVALAEAS
jgi:hypothetical protein